jgi:hypothetical protein
MGLNLKCLPDDMVHVPGITGEDTGVLELDEVSQIDDVLSRG